MSSFLSITYNNIKADVERYLKKKYNKANMLFSPGSPYGQILDVTSALHEKTLLYIKSAINRLDFTNINSSNNQKEVYTAAILAGHIPTRSISATGTLKLTVKSNVDLDSRLPGGRINIPNKLLLRNKTNSLDYSIDIGGDSVSHRVTRNYTFYLSIKQGRWATQTFTGTGENLQTVNVKENGRKDIENFSVEVFVNGVLWDQKKVLYDMLPDEESCIVRTGIGGGIDIVFGTGDFGKVPGISDLIEVNYLISAGSQGNIFRRTINDFKFIDSVTTASGETVDIENIFDVEIFTDINFGADRESVEFTRNILPISSNNYVLGLPQQYAYELKKMGVFSHVNAYEKTGTIFIVATPNIKLFKNRNADYFNVDIGAFELDRYEKSKIDKYLRTSGNIQLTKKYRVDSPDLSFYSIDVNYMAYSDIIDDSIQAEILDKISNYFLNLNKVDRIPKSDLIKELSDIKGIYSVDVNFKSKKNEDYHREFMEIAELRKSNITSSYNTSLDSVVSASYDRNKSVGIDPVLGDILFEPNEIPVIRGGWYDRNGIFYRDAVDGAGMKSVNILKKGVVDSKKK